MSLLLLGAGPQVDRFVTPVTGAFAFLNMATQFTPITTVVRYRDPGPVGNGYTVILQSGVVEELVENSTTTTYTLRPDETTVAEFEAHFPTTFLTIASGSADPGATINDLGLVQDVLAGGHS